MRRLFSSLNNDPAQDSKLNMDTSTILSYSWKYSHTISVPILSVHWQNIYGIAYLLIIIELIAIFQ